MDKRALRKAAIPNRKINVRCGLFCVDRIKYVVCTAIKNIAHCRTLILYVYDKEMMSAEDFSPRWTTFQTKDDYITLCRDDGKDHWYKSQFQRLNNDYYFTNKCAFYSVTDQERVSKFFYEEKLKGFDCLDVFQERIKTKRTQEASLKKQKKIAERMSVIGRLPRDIKGYMHRETLPQYIFYDYHRGKAPMKGYCTACKHDVMVSGVKDKQKGICPRCKKQVTFRSRGRCGRFHDRSTAQIIERVSDNEIVIRYVKAYCWYYKNVSTPKFEVYENARDFIRWEGNKIAKIESYYYSYNCDGITPWCRGERPTRNKWAYYFEADQCGFLYHRNLNEALKGTPWQYCALKEYYYSDWLPLTVLTYLRTYLRYPSIEYLVKLQLYNLATFVVYGEKGTRYLSREQTLNCDGKTITEVLRVDKKYIPMLRSLNPTGARLDIIHAMIAAGCEPDLKLLFWCEQKSIGDPDHIREILKYVTPHKLMRYTTEYFDSHPNSAGAIGSYRSMSLLISDYKDYLSMSEALGHDMRSNFVLFPKNLKEAHNRVNELTKIKVSKENNRKIVQMFKEMQRQYFFKSDDFVVLAPRSSKDIIREGDKLHHCVGRYVPDVANKRCAILFIRKTSEPQKPFCTVEVRGGKVAQARIQNNEDPPPEAQEFISLWEQLKVSAPERVAA